MSQEEIDQQRDILKSLAREGANEALADTKSGLVTSVLRFAMQGGGFAGVMCVLFGTFIVWILQEMSKERKEWATERQAFVQIVQATQKDATEALRANAIATEKMSASIQGLTDELRRKP